jgi:hypothetical protein
MTPSKAWVDLLADVVPNASDTVLLRAILWEGDAGRNQWAAWVESVADPRAYFEREWTGRKGLLAFIGQQLRDKQAELSPEFGTYVRVAQVREELRSKIFVEVMTEVTEGLAAAGITPLLLNGASHAFTVYADPLIRHNHGIDLLLSPRELQPAQSVLKTAGFEFVRELVIGHDAYLECRHNTGLALTMRTMLFRVPHLVRDASTCVARSVEVSTPGGPVRILCPADRLCHTLGEAATAATRRNLRWACDAYLLLKSLTEADFDKVAQRLAEWNLSTPGGSLLGYFRSNLNVEVPKAVVQCTVKQGAPRDVEAERALLSIALRSSNSVQRFLRSARGNRAMFRKALRFAIAPSREHIAYQYDVSSKILLPTLYLLRAARYFRRRFLPSSFRQSAPCVEGAFKAPSRLGSEAKL